MSIQQIGSLGEWIEGQFLTQLKRSHHQSDWIVKHPDGGYYREEVKMQKPFMDEVNGIVDECGSMPVYQIECRLEHQKSTNERENFVWYDWTSIQWLTGGKFTIDRYSRWLDELEKNKLYTEKKLPNAPLKHFYPKNVLNKTTVKIDSTKFNGKFPEEWIPKSTKNI